MLHLMNAYMGGLAGNEDGDWNRTKQIDAELIGSDWTFDNNYKEKLFCGMINLKDFDVTQRYIQMILVS